MQQAEQQSVSTTGVVRPEIEALFGQLLPNREPHDIARSAGELRKLVMQEVLITLDRNRGNPLHAMRAGLQRLRDSNLVSEQELKDLRQIAQAVSATQRGRRNPDRAFEEVKTIYNRMLGNNGASPVALAIGGIAASGPISSPISGVQGGNGNVTLAINRSDKIDAAIIGGAIVGAGVGFALGGLGGAVIGAAIGGITAGVATACAT